MEKDTWKVFKIRAFINKLYMYIVQAFILQAPIRYTVYLKHVSLVLFSTRHILNVGPIVEDL